MALTTYSELKTAISGFLVRDDVADATIADFVRMAETTFDQVLRAPGMVDSATVTVATGGEGDLPTDWLETVYLRDTTNQNNALAQTDAARMLKLRSNRLSANGTPRYFTTVGRRLIVAPPPTASTSLQIRYYRQIPKLTTAGQSNWLLDEAPHLYVYGALRHAYTYLMEDARQQLMESALGPMIDNARAHSQTLTLEQMAAAAPRMA